MVRLSSSSFNPEAASWLRFIQPLNQRVLTNSSHTKINFRCPFLAGFEPTNYHGRTSLHRF